MIVGKGFKSGPATTDLAPFTQGKRGESLEVTRLDKFASTLHLSRVDSLTHGGYGITCAKIPLLRCRVSPTA